MAFSYWYERKDPSYAKRFPFLRSTMCHILSTVQTNDRKSLPVIHRGGNIVPPAPEAAGGQMFLLYWSKMCDDAIAMRDVCSVKSTDIAVVPSLEQEASPTPPMSDAWDDDMDATGADSGSVRVPKPGTQESTSTVNPPKPDEADGTPPVNNFLYKQQFAANPPKVQLLKRNTSGDDKKASPVSGGATPQSSDKATRDGTQKQAEYEAMRARIFAEAEADVVHAEAAISGLSIKPTSASDTKVDEAANGKQEGSKAVTKEGKVDKGHNNNATHQNTGNGGNGNNKKAARIITSIGKGNNNNNQRRNNNESAYEFQRNQQQPYGGGTFYGNMAQQQALYHQQQQQQQYYLQQQQQQQYYFQQQQLAQQQMYYRQQGHEQGGQPQQPGNGGPSGAYTGGLYQISPQQYQRQQHQGHSVVQQGHSEQSAANGYHTTNLLPMPILQQGGGNVPQNTTAAKSAANNPATTKPVATAAERKVLFNSEEDFPALGSKR